MLLTGLLLFSCKDKYFPNIPSTGTGYLVIEGVLNAGNEPTTINITRTYDLNGTSANNGETGAVVTVEGKDNSVKQLTPISAGVYQNEYLNLLTNNQYRLHIKTKDGKEYVSDYVNVKITPEIDSIGYKQNADGVQIYVNTHDPGNNTRYYRWSFEDTWEINSFYYSMQIYDSSMTTIPKVRDRKENEMVFRCWKYGQSTNLLFASSAKLTDDVIYQQPIINIPTNNEKLAVKYSIFVKQYSLDKGAYEFYDLMKKNTESMGTIFDPMPSEVRGNITCISNPKEIVIGYISASTVTEKRVFISRPPGWNFMQPCDLATVTVIPDDSTEYYFRPGYYVPVNILDIVPPGVVVSYTGASPRCVDCRARGGDLQEPSYWKD